MDRKTLVGIVAETFEVTEDALNQKNRGKKPIAEARQSLFYLYHKLHPDKSQRELGLEFDRDKSTIRYAIQKMERDPPQKLTELEKRLVSPTTPIQAGDDLETSEPQ